MLETLLIADMLSPGLLYAGLAGVSVPLLIHLLNRRRFRQTRWAAMTFLIQAYKKNRRRIRLQELLLLALRCLAIVLIGSALARIFIRPSAIAAVVGSPTPTQRVILIDDSFSMSLRSSADQAGSTTVFESATGAAGTLVRWLQAESPADPVSVLLLSDADAPLINTTPASQIDREQLQQQLSELAPSHDIGTWSSALMTITERLEAQPDVLNATVYILSDFQQRDWQNRPVDSDSPPSRDDRSDAGSTHLLNALAQWQQGSRQLRTVLIDCGQEDTSNTSIDAVVPDQSRSVAGVNSRFRVRVTNHGDTAAAASQMRVFLDTAALPPLRVPPIDANKTVEVPLEVTFAYPQDTALTVELTDDALPIDNTRSLAVPVVRAIRVLMVNGEPAVDPYEDEVFLLSVALRPEGAQFSGNDVTIIDDNDLASQEIGAFDVVILANVPHLNAEVAQQIKTYVEGGGGLAIFLGDQVDVEAYNRQLFNNTSPLIPVKLTEIAASQRNDAGVPVEIAEKGRSLVQSLADKDSNLLADVRIRQWIGCQLLDANDTATTEDVVDSTNGSASVKTSPSKRENATQTSTTSQAEVLLQLARGDHAPLLIEGQSGRGHVWLMTTSCDKEWNNLADHPVYVVLAMQMIQDLSRAFAFSDSYRVGETIELPVHATQQHREVVVHPPGYPETPASVTSLEMNSATGRPVIRWNRTGQAGIYEFRLTETAQAEHVRLAAVNVDPGESDLQAADLNRVAAGASELEVEVLDVNNINSIQADVVRIEIWPVLISLAVMVLMAEQTLAWGFGSNWRFPFLRQAKGA
jgi:uncharacterized membrane protein